MIEPVCKQGKHRSIQRYHLSNFADAALFPSIESTQSRRQVNPLMGVLSTCDVARFAPSGLLCIDSVAQGQVTIESCATSMLVLVHEGSCRFG